MLAGGDRVPGIAVPDFEGRTVSLEDFLGRRLLTFVWASW